MRKLSITALCLLMTALVASVSNAQTYDTSSVNQVQIHRVTLTGGNGNGNCPSDNASDNALENFQRTLTIIGRNFSVSGNEPIVTIGDTVLQGTQRTGDTQITATIDCRDYDPAAGYRLIVSTGNGRPFNDGISFSTLRRGNNGNNGENGKDGNNGRHGRGFRREVIPANASNNPCAQGAAHLLIPQVFDEIQGKYVDDLSAQVAPVCHGKDGAPGQNGPPGLNGKNGAARGWLKNFGQGTSPGVNISSAATTVLSQVVSGTNGYVVNAKVNAPFGNNAKMVQCSLLAIENGVSTTLDGSDTHLIGSSTVTARGVIALGGVYRAQGGDAASVTINVVCSTGGDSRTLNKGMMNITGVDSIN